MPDARAIANAISKHFGGSGEAPSSGASTSSSPSGNGDADAAKANSAFHSDLDSSICPDCHTAVKQVMYDPGKSMNTSEVDPEASVARTDAARKAKQDSDAANLADSAKMQAAEYGGK